jgi:Na+-transporting methylmalonyl-CoA/oxaloacetate decarboxylase gamma subunit
MNKETKQNIIEGIGFVLMVLSIITLIGAMYELKEVSEDVRELRTIMRK